MSSKQKSKQKYQNKNKKRNNNRNNAGYQSGNKPVYSESTQSKGKSLALKIAVVALAVIMGVMFSVPAIFYS